MSKRPLHVSPFCSVHNPRGTFRLSNFVFPGLSDALRLSDHENLFTVLIYQHPPHLIFKSFHVFVMNSQLLFADSLTSTLLLKKSSTGVP